MVLLLCNSECEMHGFVTRIDMYILSVARRFFYANTFNFKKTVSCTKYYCVSWILSRFEVWTNKLPIDMHPYLVSGST
jgi:hypothetical protein